MPDVALRGFRCQGFPCVGRDDTRTSVSTKSIIIVSGMIAADPGQGGAVWAVLQYLLGLERLGHEVLFIEPIRAASLRPAGAPLAASENARYFRRVMAEHGLGQRSSLWLSGTGESVGLSVGRLREASGRAGVLFNLSGMLAFGDLGGQIPIRVYVDLDPAFNQLWSATQGIDMRFGGHTHFVTVGLAIGDADCLVPDCGRTWIRTLQPVVLQHWPPAGALCHDALTTVANWRGYGSIEHGGVTYGQKAHSLRPLFGLPRRTPEKFRLALAIHPDETRDLAALAENGWELVDPALVTGTPSDYRDFVAGSRAEFGVAKSGYVASRCGWFSDRSACYLASGRPVIAQDTGFSRHLPTGRGLFRFTDADGVLAALDSLRSDYAGHRRAARGIAEDHFDSDKVLGRLLDEVGA